MDANKDVAIDQLTDLCRGLLINQQQVCRGVGRDRSRVGRQPAEQMRLELATAQREFAAHLVELQVRGQV